MSDIEIHWIPPGTSPTRLSEYALGRFLGLPSRQSVKKAIKRGEMTVDGQPAQTGTWVQAGQQLTWTPTALPPPKPFPIPLEIPFQDEHLAMVYKPAGLLTSGNQYRTLTNALVHALPTSPVEDHLPWPQPVHRLDRPTQGLVLVARSQRAKVKLGQMLADRQVQKRYVALVAGIPESVGIWHGLIDGQVAESRFACLESVPSLRNGHVSRLALWPQTGRTHQLRIHCAEAGFPILGDRQYGPAGKVMLHKGLFLAALGLTLPHPVFADQQLDIQREMPHKFRQRLIREQRMFERGQEYE